MPSGPRIRSNNVYGITSNNPLTAAGTTYSSISLPLLPVVVSSHAIVVFDPKRVYGDPEIVVITTHTAASTVATIVRGQYGTSARSHPLGTAWAHVPVDEDWIKISTSTSRPSDPYRGQMIFEYDTDKFVARSITDVWTDAIPLGAWQSWTPTITNLSGGTLSAVYQKVGRMVNFRFKYTLAGANMGTNPQFTLPIAAHADFVQNMPIGSCSLLDTGVQLYMGWPVMVNSTTVVPVAISTGGATAVNTAVTATSPFTWGAGDILMVIGTYEAVS